MRKIIFVLFLLALFFSPLTRGLNFSPAFALTPVIIDESIQGPPVGTGNDQNYHSNDILNTNTIKCAFSIGISQSFDPIVSGTGPIPTYTPYDVNKIEGKIDMNDNWTNTDFKDSTLHLINLSRHPLSATSLGQSFLSLNSDSINGTAGMTTRSTPYQVQQCQKSQRLIYAIQSLNPASNLTYYNEQIGWQCPDLFYSLAEKSNGSGCISIRLADIAASIREPVFYPTTVNCNSLPLPDPIALPVTIPHPHLIAPDIALKLFNSINPIDTGSLATIVEVCDADGSGNPINCKKSERQIPRGNISATNGQVVSQIIPYQQPVSASDLCQTTSQSSSEDRPNPLTFIGAIIKFFGTIVDSAKTYTGTVISNTYLDSRIQAPVDQDKAFLNNLIPAADQQKFQTKNQKGSSANNKTLDVGNPVPRSVLGKELLPAGF